MNSVAYRKINVTVRRLGLDNDLNVKGAPIIFSLLLTT